MFGKLRENLVEALDKSDGILLSEAHGRHHHQHIVFISFIGYYDILLPHPAIGEES